MLNKLKIIGRVNTYSTENTWETYKNIISPIKSELIKGSIKAKSVKYQDEFNEKYNPYTKENNWGSNLDEYIITLNSKLEATIVYYQIRRYSNYELRRNFKF